MRELCATHQFCLLFLLIQTTDLYISEETTEICIKGVDVIVDATLDVVADGGEINGVRDGAVVVRVALA